MVAFKLYLLFNRGGPLIKHLILQKPKNNQKHSSLELVINGILKGILWETLNLYIGILKMSRA